MGLFDVFKDKDEDENSGGMAEETPSFESEPQPEETVESRDETPATEPVEETTSYSQTGTAVQSQLGIEQLMDKRFKLGEAIDYVATMIKELIYLRKLFFQISNIDRFIFNAFYQTCSFIPQFFNHGCNIVNSLS